MPALTGPTRPPRSARAAAAGQAPVRADRASVIPAEGAVRAALIARTHPVAIRGATQTDNVAFQVLDDDLGRFQPAQPRRTYTVALERNDLALAIAPVFEHAAVGKGDAGQSSAPVVGVLSHAGNSLAASRRQCYGFCGYAPGGIVGVALVLTRVIDPGQQGARVGPGRHALPLTDWCTRIDQGLADDTPGHVVLVAGPAAIRVGAVHHPVGCVVAPGNCTAVGATGPFNSLKTFLTVGAIYKTNPAIDTPRHGH